MSLFNKQHRHGGFTILEVLIAIAVLLIGVVSVAALSGSMLTASHRSKYMTLASSLASEKLEDLNRPANTEPEVCVPSGSTTVGSLTADVLQTTTCASGASNTENYYDDVSIIFGQNGNGDCPNVNGGCFAETVSTVNGGNVNYITTYHSPDGHITTGAPSVNAASYVSFHRRWIIEQDTPVVGVRRITVVVQVVDKTDQPAANFQMSMVRP